MQTLTDSATFGARIMAFAIDLVLLEIMNISLLLLLAGKLIQASSIEPFGLLVPLSLYLVLLFLILLFLPMVYFIVFHAWLGQTIGKMVMGIKVVTDNNETAGLGVAFLRWSGYFLSFMPLAAGFLWAAVDKDQCAWHDRLARTRVISAENS